MLEIDLRTGQHPGGQNPTRMLWRQRMSACGFFWPKPRSIPRGCLPGRGSTPKSERHPTGCKSCCLKSCTSVKNTLATVSAIVSQSLRNVEGVDHAQQAIEGRLLALGRAHDLLLHTKRSSADLGTVVRSAIEAFDDRHESKFSISGPDIRINSGAVVAVAMTLNELCTNAVKHGAFSGPKGRVDLHWTIDQ